MKLLLIYTGGTIGMVQDPITKSLIPGSIKPIEDFLKIKRFSRHVNTVSTQKQIDSSNFGVTSFQEVATIIEKNYTRYNGFLILMGTDTMAYISSLLSYCTLGLNKPIIFTGGQIPLLEKTSDSIRNLEGAISGVLTHKFPNEVGIFFSEKWFRAVGVTKIDTEENDAYLVPNITRNFEETKAETFQIVKEMEAKIAVVKLIPFGNEEVLRIILESSTIDGIVLEVFGAGNIPSFSNKLKQLFKDKIDKGFKVVIVSQCLKGQIALGKYKASDSIKELGLISGNAMTTESAVAKMMFLHHKKLNSQEYQFFFENSLKGE